MELAKSFEPHAIERRWYPIWESRGYFAARARPRSRPPYCIQLPPPNVTGTLHMGHAFQQTLMDALIRYHRMRGYNTNWVAGTDHAGIATQIVVERQLEAEGKTRHDLGREKFVERVWEWKEESGSTITRQMRRLGASANWTSPTPKARAAGYFTMDARMSRAVVEVFVRLHEQGLIYRGKRLVNWDPVLGTAVSDLEVDSEEEDGKMWEIRYPLADGAGASGGRDHAAGDDARRRRGRGATRRTSATAHLIGKQRQAAAHRPHHPGHRRRLRRPGVRHRLRQDHAGARLQRLPGRAAPQPAADQHPHARRARSTTTRRRPTAAWIASTRASACSPTCEAQGCWSSPRRPHKLQGAALGTHRRDRRADAHRPVVREDGRPGQARAWTRSPTAT